VPSRVMHWSNAVFVTILLMSGLNIFNAHPALYGGKSSYSGVPPILAIRGFPYWLALPGLQWLAMARRWHFFFAWLLVVNGIVFVTYSVLSRHLHRNLVPTVQDWRSVGRSIFDHLRFRHATGEAAKRYNVLQKIRLFGGDFFLSSPDDPDGAGYVAGPGRIVPRLGSYLFRPSIRKDHPFRWCSS